jgi:phosphotransferase system  glucose/maltose/N-acetylglucosamine-specific IIC component
MEVNTGMAEAKTTRRRLLDIAALFGASTLVVLLGLGSFFLSDWYHVDLIWPILTWMSLVFFAGIGWDLRREFGSPAFVSFFVAWLLIHSLIFVLVVGYLSWLCYALAVPVELFIFYVSAALLFGVKPPGRR